MAYDEGLAERIREFLADEGGVVEKRMFGGLCFLIRGNMCLGIVKDELMVRAGPESCDALLRLPHARKMDFTGRPMKGFLFVGTDGLESDRDLSGWISHGVSYAKSLPAKGESPPDTERPASGRGAGRRRQPEAPRHRTRG